MKPSPESSPLEIYLLGVVDFEEVQSLQRRLVYDVEECGAATLILCEHPPTISVGRSGSRPTSCPTTRRCVDWESRSTGSTAVVAACSICPASLRLTWSCPCKEQGLTLTAYVDRLHRVILEVLEEFDLHGTVRADLPGVFLGQARVASVGVAVSRWIAYHGFTLNVGPYLDLFDILDEPGLEHASLRQTSMESRRQRHTSMSKVREALIRSVEDVFGLDRHHVYTQHPLIRRKVLSHVYAPSPG